MTRLTQRISISKFVTLLKVTEFAASFSMHRQFGFTLCLTRPGRGMLHNSGVDVDSTRETLQLAINLLRAGTLEMKTSALHAPSTQLSTP
jgi:hypothetical protein